MRRNFAIIKTLGFELCQIKTGKKKPSGAEVKKTIDFYVGLFGYDDLSWLSQENLEGLKQILISQINAERKRRGLPGISDWFQI